MQRIAHVLLCSLLLSHAVAFRPERCVRAVSPHHRCGQARREHSDLLKSPSVVALRAESATNERAALLRPRTLAGLAAFGGVCGPLVDAVHNSALLEYEVAPVVVPALFFEAKTSLLVPPLLAFACA